MLILSYCTTVLGWTLGFPQTTFGQSIERSKFGWVCVASEKYVFSFGRYPARTFDNEEECKEGTLMTLAVEILQFLDTVAILHL